MDRKRILHAIEGTPSAPEELFFDGEPAPDTLDDAELKTWAREVAQGLRDTFEGEPDTWKDSPMQWLTRELEAAIAET